MMQKAFFIEPDESESDKGKDVESTDKQSGMLQD